MKKLIIINILIINTLLTFTTQCSEKKATNQNIIQMLATRFATFKNYIFQQKKPFQQFVLPSNTQSWIHYNFTHKRALLFYNTIQVKDFEPVINYYFSPTKKYLIIRTISPGTGLRLTGLKNLFGYDHLTTVIDATSGKTIKQFNGDVVMFEFSPDEETLIVATAYNPAGALANLRNINQKPTKIHEDLNTQRQATESGDILFYEIFDIPTGLITTKYENIQATQFTQDNKLIIKYDDGTLEEINLSSKQQSFTNKLKQTLSYLTRGYLLNETDYSPKYESTTLIKQDPSLIQANYHYYNKRLTLTTQYPSSKIFNDVSFYSFSPQRSYIVINKKPEGAIAAVKSFAHLTGMTEKTDDVETVIWSTQSNQQRLSLTNVITYEFNTNETKIIILNTSSTENNSTYKLFDLNENNLIKEFTLQENIKSLYFNGTNELIGINQNNEKIAYDPTTGETFYERDQRLQREILAQQQNERKKQEEEIKRKEQLEQKRLAEEKQKQDELEAEIKRKTEEQETLKKIYNELPSGEERLARIQEQEAIKPVETPIKAVQTRGLEAIQQAASGIVSDIQSGIQSYFSPETQPQTEEISPLTEVVVDKPEEAIASPNEEKEPQKSQETFEQLMNALQEIMNNKELEYHEQNASISNQLLKITNKLNTLQKTSDYENFVNAYNQFSPEQKQTFNLYFFSPTEDKKRVIHNESGNTIILSLDDSNTMTASMNEEKSQESKAPIEQTIDISTNHNQSTASNNGLEQLMHKLQGIIDNKKLKYNEQSTSISNQLLKITNELSNLQNITDYENFANIYNQFSREQKESFNLYFFPPQGDKKRLINNESGDTFLLSLDNKNIMTASINKKE